MEYPELVAYIAEQTQEGMSAEGLRQSLMEAGWKETDIENALHDVAAGLDPATPGVSIHADLAQVRGMVSHLARRVKTLEAHLASAGVLPMQLELGAQKTLPAPPHRFVWLRRFMGLAIAGALTILLVGYVSMAAPYLLVLLGIAVMATFFGLIMLVGRHPWFASFFIDAGVGIAAGVLWIAYRKASIEWTIALAIAVLLILIIIVAERWNERIGR